MSLTYECNILCDGKDCHECITTEPVEMDDIGCAIDWCCLHNKWIHEGEHYYCPDCAKTLHQTQGTKQQTN